VFNYYDYNNEIVSIVLKENKEKFEIIEVPDE